MPETAGPPDTGAKIRATVYGGSSALLSLLGLAVTLFGLNKGYADGGTQIIQGLLTIFGASPLAVASAKTVQQVKNGTFDPPPPPQIAEAPSSSAIAVQGIQEVHDAYSNLTDSIVAGLQRVGDIAGAVLPAGTVKNLGPLASQIIGFHKE